MYECKTRDYPALDANEKGTVGHWFSRRLSSLEVEVRMPITLISVERNQERRQNQYKVREQALRDKSTRERKIEIQTQGS